MRKIKIPLNDQNKMSKREKLRRSYLKKSSIQETIVQKPKGGTQATLPFTMRLKKLAPTKR